MYIDGQPKSSWPSTCRLLGLPPRLDGTLVSISSGRIAQPGFSRRGWPVVIKSLCRSRWDCSLGIASLDIWMVATLIRYRSSSKQSALLLAIVSFVPLGIIGPAHYKSSTRPRSRVLYFLLLILFLPRCLSIGRPPHKYSKFLFVY